MDKSLRRNLPHLHKCEEVPWRAANYGNDSRVSALLPCDLTRLPNPAHPVRPCDACVPGLFLFRPQWKQSQLGCRHARPAPHRTSRHALLPFSLPAAGCRSVLLSLMLLFSVPIVPLDHVNISLWYILVLQVSLDHANNRHHGYFTYSFYNIW